MKVLFVSGASRGFGKAVALQFSRSTLSFDLIVLTSRKGPDCPDLQRTRAAITSPARVLLKKLDYSQPNSGIESVLQDIAGAVTLVWINNVGTLGSLGKLNTIDMDQLRQTFQINAFGPIEATLKATQSTESIVVNVSSLAAIEPFEAWGMYCASKAASEMLHRVLATESNVRVLNYAPGPMDTDMQLEIRRDMPECALRTVFLDMHKQNKLVDPMDSALNLLRIVELNEFNSGCHVDYYD